MRCRFWSSITGRGTCVSCATRSNGPRSWWGRATKSSPSTLFYRSACPFWGIGSSLALIVQLQIGKCCPSSHVVPINERCAADLCTARSCWRTPSRSSSPHRRCWRPLIAICSRKLRISGSELAERNAALTRSLEENDRMRAALQQMHRFHALRRAGAGPGRSHRHDQSGRPQAAGAWRARTCASLHDLSAISQIDFESLMDRLGGPPRQ